MVSRSFMLNGRGAYMIDGASTTPSTNERNSGASEKRHINLLPWVLVSAYDHARVISIEQEQRVIM